MGYSRELKGVPVRSLKVRLHALAAERPIAERRVLALFFGCRRRTVWTVHGSLLMKMGWVTLSLPQNGFPLWILFSVLTLPVWVQRKP